MKTRRILPWTLACLLLLGGIAALAFFPLPTILHARIAEKGGFMPDSIQARVGQPLRLRLIADDVEHTFAVGQNPMEPLLLEPGQPVEITLTFDKPGQYTFYSTTPSSPNFWRMRGTIEVSGDGPTPVAESPLYERLGLSLDDEHMAMGDEQAIEWARRPAASRGAAFKSLIPPAYLTGDFYVATSPMEAHDKLRANPALSDSDVWDMVAFIWQENTSAAALAEGEHLYQVNCAACHGKSGAGDGQFAKEMKAIAEKNKDEHGIQAPTDFSHPEHLIESKPAIVQGKTLRGGMGTGMPMWGSIFTDQQLWNLVAYLYSFQFDYSR
jgi:mono/diheme cytochrome c family protein/plastocyanin